MTTLDARARSAAHAIHAGVAEFIPAASFDAVVVRQQRWRTFQAASAGAAVAAVIIVAGIMATPAPDSEVAEVPVTVVEPTIPTPRPVVPPPIVPTTTPVTTTTEVVVAPPVTEAEPEPEPDPDTTPPLLTITSPTAEEHFEIDVIEFRGETEPGATVFGGRYQADVDDKGNWAIVLVLSPGANGARFVATDAAGNQAEARVTVYYDVPETTEPPPEEPPPEEPPKEEIVFTAHSVYGSCEENPPYDVYWGTAPPGTLIYVESEFGGGVTDANADGGWEIKVFFPEAPFDTEFTVKVRDDKGNKKTFGFVRYG